MATSNPNQQPYNWPIHDLASVWNQPDPTFEFLAGSIAKRPSVNLWYGSPASFKTILLQDLAICVSGSTDWLLPLPGNNVAPFAIAKNYPVLWVDQDSGQETIRMRFKALARGHKVMPKPNDISWLSCPTPPINLWPGRNAQDMKEFLTNQYTIFSQAISRKVGMIVIDNLGTVSPGADENSKDMLDVLAGIRQLSEWTNTSVHLIHHPNKKGDKSQYGARGHSSIMAAVDYAFEVTRDDIDDVGMVRCTKSRHMPVETFSFMFTYLNEKNVLREARFFGLESDTKDNPLKVAIDAIRQHFTDGMNQTAIVQLVKQHADVGRSKTLTAIAKLERLGELDNTTGPNNSKLYCKGTNWPPWVV